MDKIDAVKSIIKNNGGIAKTADFVAVGLTNYDVANLCKEGYLERLRQGYYQLAGQEDIKEEQVLASLLPESIVCVESALFYYGYSDFLPRQWSIAVPRTFSRTKLKIDSLATKIYYVQSDLFEIGKTNGYFNGVRLAVYDRERTICDCFKYRTKLDSEIFNKALNAYAVDKNKNLSNLSSYAKKMRVYKKLMDVMEVLLGG
ncbi:MAG TPA: type IV toxin-antitoxin system AbiEi family antitoxin domain-containing protein [Candidatus Eisenbergiella merdipullorum]|uniref:Type IV toxin-antitoxin system AbiEi family antitoxin domain-containing protein n=1 Tax=Candidatus Eisenbergiella merdipullorum TaxID=2838553 RepID=A0A9D2I873_9FIRM|nr:type IV toxin-antitoxin system AbiEi family antitoxin domain-containing protein [Candidatus Eisenbergiella merdipullorum]